MADNELNRNRLFIQITVQQKSGHQIKFCPHLIGSNAAYDDRAVKSYDRESANFLSYDSLTSRDYI